MDLSNQPRIELYGHCARVRIVHGFRTQKTFGVFSGSKYGYRFRKTHLDLVFDHTQGLKTPRSRALNNTPIRCCQAEWIHGLSPSPVTFSPHTFHLSYPHLSPVRCIHDLTTVRCIHDLTTVDCQVYSAIHALTSISCFLHSPFGGGSDTSPLGTHTLYSTSSYLSGTSHLSPVMCIHE